MKQPFKLFAVLLIFVFAANKSIGQGPSPTYNLTAKNFTIGSISYPSDVLYFDIYIQWTNPGVAPNFEYSGGQFYFSFNKDVLKGTWPPAGPSNNLDTSEFSYKIISSEFFPSPSLLPRNNSLYTATAPTANILRGFISKFHMAGYNISPVFPGTRIVTYRLWNKTGSFNPGALNLIWRNPPIVTFATSVYAYIGTDNRDITTPSTHTVENSPVFFAQAMVLNLTMITEGLYDPAVNQLARRDTLRAYLRNSSSPYNIVDVAKTFIDSTTFSNRFFFDNAANGTYYIQIKHFNSIETWSKPGGEPFAQGDTTFYNFTASNTQAYGNNLKLKGSKYCIYSGDVNQDGFIDATDLARLDNDSYNLLSGKFLVSDLNGDSFVDGVDFLIVDNNRNVRTISPLSGGDRYISP